MRYALLADIHANLPALEAVLAAAASEGIDRYLVAGDSVGYYFWPRETLDLLLELDATVVRGNHEDALLEAAADLSAVEAAPAAQVPGLLASLSELDSAALSRIAGWPSCRTIDDRHGLITVCHGSPRDTCQYVYPDATHEVLMELADGSSAIIMGHTHYPMARRVGGTLFANPGSVGQPRDGVPGAAWAILDSDTGVVDQRRESYDIASVVAEAKRRQPDARYLHEILVRTR